MSKDLIDYITKLNIYVYVLSDGSTYIGKLQDVHESAVELVGVCKMQGFVAEGKLQQMMLPVIPASLDQNTVLAKAHIMLQSPASLTLKKAYCDTLLRLKLPTDIEVPTDQSMNLETLDTNGTANPFKDRWK